MSCQDDAILTGPVSLFFGIETWNWTTQQFLNEASTAKQHGITTVFIKVSEVGSTAGDIWYGGIDAFDKNVYQPLKAAGMNVIPYQFSWGPQSKDFNIDTQVATEFLTRYPEFCLDLEGGQWTGQAGADAASKLNAALVNLPNKLYLSHSANFAASNQSGFMQAMSPAVNVFMPMSYDDYLESVTYSQLQALNPGACIQPTYDLSSEFGPNNVLANVRDAKAHGSPAISLWYEGFANSEWPLVDQVVALFGGGPVVLNNKGMVADITQSYQLSENEMELCGPWTVAALLFAGFPGKGPIGSAEQIDQWVDAAVGVMGYPNPADFPGVSVGDEEWLLKRSGLHYFEITPDIPRITRAVKAGYPVIITAFEPNIKAWDFNQNAWVNAYTWNISANHVLPVAGIDNNGNFICADQLNNAFQGYWPPIYDASRISPSYAAVVQLPWLAPIPSGDPLTWPSGFNAQLGGSSVAVPSGWSDNGSTLSAPNGQVVVLGFRSHVINAVPQWASDDYPLEHEHQVAVFEESNPSWGTGGGAQQVFRRHMLAYTGGKVVEEFMGPEILFLRTDRDKYKTQLAAETALEAKDQTTITSLNAQIASLQAQLAAGGITPEEQTAINNAVAALQALQPFVK